MTKNNRSAATIADALHLAADEYLAANLHQYDTDFHKVRYSCNAVSEACYELDVNLGGVFVGLKNMGCPTSSLNAFNDQGYDKFSEEAQGMRYMWLKWAALMAEEQGV
jgi:hypothetical protein